LGCDQDDDACRERHVARHLEDTERKGRDFESRCPRCGHQAFRVSHPRVRAYRHVWTCACKGCGCDAAELRAVLLKLDIPLACLGSYDGPVKRAVDPDTARRVDLVIRDILAVPHLKPADIRIMLADAQGRKVPAKFGPFVKFAVGLGIGATQAKEAAARWCRPPDCRPPQTGGQGVDH
jgi:hypothetical protein